MKTNWIDYTAKDFQNLKSKQVKLNSGGIKTISMIVGSSLYDNSHNEIDESDILFFAEKEDKTRYFKLQKHFETLSKFDNELLDDLEFAISDTLGIDSGNHRNEALQHIFKELKEFIEASDNRCLTESKKYL